MAIPKTARLRSRVSLTRNVHELTFDMIDPPELGYDSGKYIIIATNVLKENGDPVKRAYSIASPPEDQTSFKLCFKLIPGGVATNFLVGLKPGDEIRFSGPWGKNYQLPAVIQPDLNFIFVASGTGFSAVHGHLWRLLHDSDWKGRAEFHWGLRLKIDLYHEEALDLLRKDPRFDIRVTFSDEPGGIMLEREFASKAITAPDNVLCYLAGNGVVIEKVTQSLMTSGVDVDRIFKEIFFP